MKIAIFSDCYLDLTGGIVSSIKAQKVALENDGHEVVIFSTGFKRSEAELAGLAKQNIFVVPSCRLFFKGLTPVSRRPRIIEKWLLREHPEIREFDVFYVHYESGCSIAGLRLARKLGVPSVQVMHGREDAGVENIVPFGLKTVVAGALNWFHSWYLPHPVKVRRDDYLARSVARVKMWEMMVNHANYADAVVTPSKHFAKKLAHYGVKGETKVCPNGYPDERFPAEVNAKELRSGEAIRIVWHSRLFGEKRIVPFLEALSKVKGKYHLDVYGDGADLARAKRLAARRGMMVKFHGVAKFETVQAAIMKSHLDVLASYDFDDYPMTLVEAEACGVPVFFCDPDMKEIVPRGGYVLAEGPSVKEMARALEDLLEHPERIAEMSRAMLAHREEVLISKRIKTVEKVFHDII